MNRTLLGAGAGLVLAVMALPGAAQAQCWFDGWTTVCGAPLYYAPAYWGSPYAAFTPYDYRDYRYKPDWLPSYPGPRPSSGGGH